jgi:hypothetical protein
MSSPVFPLHAVGLINFCASGFQQWGISLTSASKCAFIAGFDLFLTPVFSLLVPTSKQNALPSRSTWLAVSIAMVGLFLLSGSRLDDLELGKVESATLRCHTLFTDKAHRDRCTLNEPGCHSKVCVAVISRSLMPSCSLVFDMNTFHHYSLLLLSFADPRRNGRKLDHRFDRLLDLTHHVHGHGY